MRGTVGVLAQVLAVSAAVSESVIKSAGFTPADYDHAEHGNQFKAFTHGLQIAAARHALNEVASSADLPDYIAGPVVPGQVPGFVQRPQNPAKVMMEAIRVNPGLFSALTGANARAAPYVPKKEKLQPVLRQDAIREKLYFEEYILPSTTESNFLSRTRGERGMIEAFRRTTGPCKDCTILFATAGLEFPNGTEANTDMGGWLHHSILMATGKDRWNMGCGNNVPMPGMDAFFGGGNERTPVYYTTQDGKYDTGYYVSNETSYLAYFELMNMDPAKKTVIPTITFEYIPGKPAASTGFKRIQDVWMDLDYCSPVGADPPNNKQFYYNSTEWISPIAGTIIHVDGHMHDGGTRLKTYQNGIELCDSVATYGGSPGFVEKVPAAMAADMFSSSSSSSSASGGMSNMNMKNAKGDEMVTITHISDQTQCQPLSRIEKGDKFHVQAYYDFEQHPGEKNSNTGKLGDIMGLTVMFVAVD